MLFWDWIVGIIPNLALIPALLFSPFGVDFVCVVAISITFNRDRGWLAIGRHGTVIVPGLSIISEILVLS